MKITWHVRPAVEEDAEALTHCMHSAYAAYEARLDGKRLPPMDVDYAAEIKHFPSWVVEYEDKILGGLIMAFDHDQASIANIAVDPQYQGQGIGSGLMKFAESTAMARGFVELHLATHVLLTENISLYLHLGWKESGRDEHRVFMKKRLGE